MKVKQSSTPFLNEKQFASWWAKLWYPAKTAAIEAEQEYNNKVFEYNKIQDEMELAGTLNLTKMDNIKIIIIAILIVFAIFIFKKHK